MKKKFHALGGLGAKYAGHIALTLSAFTLAELCLRKLDYLATIFNGKLAINHILTWQQYFFPVEPYENPHATILIAIIVGLYGLVIPLAVLAVEALSKEGKFFMNFFLEDVHVQRIFFCAFLYLGLHGILLYCDKTLFLIIPIFWVVISLYLAAWFLNFGLTILRSETPELLLVNPQKGNFAERTDKVNRFFYAAIIRTDLGDFEIGSLSDRFLEFGEKIVLPYKEYPDYGKIYEKTCQEQKPTKEKPLEIAELNNKEEELEKEAKKRFADHPIINWFTVLAAFIRRAPISTKKKTIKISHLLSKERKEEINEKVLLILLVHYKNLFKKIYKDLTKEKGDFSGGEYYVYQIDPILKTWEKRQKRNGDFYTLEFFVRTIDILIYCLQSALRELHRNNPKNYKEKIARAAMHVLKATFENKNCLPKEALEILEDYCHIFLCYNLFIVMNSADEKNLSESESFLLEILKDFPKIYLDKSFQSIITRHFAEEKHKNDDTLDRFLDSLHDINGPPIREGVKSMPPLDCPNNLRYKGLVLVALILPIEGKIQLQEREKSNPIQKAIDDFPSMKKYLILMGIDPKDVDKRIEEAQKVYDVTPFSEPTDQSGKNTADTNPKK